MKTNIFQLQRSVLFVFLFAIVISISSFAYYLANDTVTAYNDSRAHLNMARLVVDNIKPGLSQLGSVWLPLPHFLMIPFIWHDGLWQSGAAGALVSMAAYIVSGIGVYILANLITRSNATATVAALGLLLNPNVIYMQATPMTEVLLLAFFIMTAVTLVRWVQTKQLSWLILCGVTLVGGTLTRYDGWFLLMWTAAIVLIVLSLDYPWVKFLLKFHKNSGQSLRENRYTVEGKLLLFLTLASVGVIFWFGWNLIIFDDPLYFANGPFSARAQQEKIAATSGLPTAGDLRLSLHAYALASAKNIGPILTILGWVGFSISILVMQSKRVLLALTVLLSPFIFHVLSLYAGNSILVLPELNIHDPSIPSSAWFNVRYGLMMLPAAVIFGTYFLRGKWNHYLLALFLVIQTVVMFNVDGVITYIDGTRGSSSLHVEEVAEWLSSNANDDGRVLASIAFHNALAFSTGFPLERFIHEGTGDVWTNSLENPYHEAKWVITSNGDVGDNVYSELVKENTHSFHRNYLKVFEANSTVVYKRSPFVVREGNNLLHEGKEFRFIGVNSYDLIYQSEDVVRETLREAKENGISVVRFWAFGEGFVGGIQPQSGITDENQLKHLDAIFSIATEEGVLLMPVLGNYWEDYGGVPQYLAWLGLSGSTSKQKDVFFTHPDAKHLYRNYVEKIINRKNVRTGVLYKEDPTIFAWELLNEPRSSSKENEQIVIDWLNEMSAYVRSLDNHHLISSGIEGFKTDVYGGEEGPTMTLASKVENIDLASTHLYVQHVQSEAIGDGIRQVIKAWSEQAHEVEKPLLIGEVGFSKEEHADRKQLFEEIFSALNSNDVDGVMFWNWALNVDTSFGISPKDDKDREILQLIKNSTQAAK